MALLSREPIAPEALTAEVAHDTCGAVLTFAGTVRKEHLGRAVVGIDYHAYDSMALRGLERIEEDAARRWPGTRIRIAHRTGALQVGETSVFIAVASPHRAEGFDALRFAIEEIKASVPIWKKELYPDGHAWIEGS